LPEIKDFRYFTICHIQGKTYYTFLCFFHDQVFSIELTISYLTHK
jgi:hypothetical protein